MSVEVAPLGYACHRACTYCYQAHAREASAQARYDLEAIKARIAAEGRPITLFGGEPLLVPIDDLEEICAFAWAQVGEVARREGRSAVGIQTDGSLLTEAHVRLFRRYRVSVGVSIDGPDELNDARAMPGGIEATRAATRKSMAAIARLLAAGIHPSLIVTLTRHNASRERQPRLLAWIEEMARAGVRHVNLHFLEVDRPEAALLAPSEDEVVAVLLGALDLMARAPVSILPLADMQALLLGRDRDANCIWHACDPLDTGAVRHIDGRGHVKNCGRTYKLGVDYEHADRSGHERALALYHTPQAFGGCAGCRFFLACKGHCPGEGAANDWRGRTAYCRVLQRVFEALEARIVASGATPISLAPDRLAVEARLMQAWMAGGRPSIEAVLAPTAEAVPADRPHGDAPHGDAPHGDAPHGDHTDAERPVITHGDHDDAG